MTMTQAPSVPFTHEHTGKNVATVRIDVTGKWTEFEQWFLLRSDAHHDNPKCRRDIEKKHLDQALERGAGILDFGDLHCAMQGKYDKRSDKSSVRPEHQNGRYLDSLVETAAEFYEPYAHNWILMGKGNHEQAIKKNHETDLTERTVALLNAKTGSHIQAGGYTGWVRFLFQRGNTRSGRNLWHTHGYGGGGPVTEDIIQSSRQRVYVENADIMVSGHVHRSWVQEFSRIRINANGAPERRDGWYVKLPTYKDEYCEGVEGWHIERGGGPRPLGAYWLRFTYADDQPYMEVVKAN